MSLTTPPNAPPWFVSFLNQLRQVITRLQNPPPIENVDGLGPASGREGQRYYVRDIDGAGTPGIAYSDGTNWRRADTNATL